MNPPVDAPRSIARRPSTSTANRSRAASSFSPPRPTKRGGGPWTTMGLAGRDEARRLRGRGAVDGDPPGVDVRLCLAAARGEAPPHQLGVEATPDQGATPASWRPWPSWPGPSWPGPSCAGAFLAGGLAHRGAFWAAARTGLEAEATRPAMRASALSRSALLTRPRLVICCLTSRRTASSELLAVLAAAVDQVDGGRRGPGRPAPRRPSPGPSPAPRHGPG